MGKRKERQVPSVGGRRRPMLQIETTIRKDNVNVTPKANALMGLIGNYDDSDEEEEEKDTRETQPKKQPITAPAPPPVTTQPKKLPLAASKKVKGSDDIDSKVADFLAEIDALDVPEADDAEVEDGKDETKEKKTTTTTTAAAASVEATATEPVAVAPSVDPELAREALEWQECLDEGTGCVYYWHTVTNEVQWEIPQIVRKYYDAVSQAALVAGQDGVATTENGTSSVSEEGTASEPDAPAAEETQPKQAAKIPAIPDEEFPLAKDEEPPPPAPQLSVPDLSTASVIATNSDSVDPAEDDLSFIGPVLPSHLQHLAVKPADEDVDGVELQQEEESMDTASPFQPEPEGAATPPTKDVDPNTLPLGARRVPAFNNTLTTTAATTSATEPAGTEDMEEEEEEDEEEFDIDKQLDLALERKKDVVSTPQAELQQEEGDQEEGGYSPALLLAAAKQKSSRPTTPTQTRDVSTQYDDTVGEEDGESLLDMASRKKAKEEKELKTEISELASTIGAKLEFLNIARKQLSKFQVLLIEMETRILDWREGALESKHLLRKLKEADWQFQNYELHAAPRGWTCHWDRTHRRYYYMNTGTGESQWEYPEDGAGQEAVAMATVTTATGHGRSGRGEVTSAKGSVTEVFASSSGGSDYAYPLPSVFSSRHGFFRRVSTRRPACSAGLQCGSSHTRDVFVNAGGMEKMAPGPKTLAIPLRIARGRGRTHMAEAMRRHLAVFRRSSAREEESSQRGSTEMPAPHQLLEARLVTSYWPSLRPEAFTGVQKISDSSKLRTTSTASSRSERDAAIRLRPWETSVLRDFGSWRRRRCVAVLIEQPRLQRFFGVFDIRAPPHRLQQAELSRSFAKGYASYYFNLPRSTAGGADYFSRRPTTSGTACFTCISRCSTSGAASISMWPAAVVAVIFCRCRALSDAVFSSRYSATGGASYIGMRCGPAIRWAVFSSRYSTAGGAPYISMRCGPATRWAVFGSRYPAAGGAPYASMRCDLAARWAVVSSRCPATTGADYVSRCPTAGGAADYVSRCRATGEADFISHCLTARRADDGSRGRMDSGILQIKRLEIKTGFHIALTESQGGIGNGSLFDAVTAGGRCPGPKVYSLGIYNPLHLGDIRSRSKRDRTSSGLQHSTLAKTSQSNPCRVISVLLSAVEDYTFRSSRIRSSENGLFPGWAVCLTTRDAETTTPVLHRTTKSDLKAVTTRWLETILEDGGYPMDAEGVTTTDRQLS
ncbi:FNBP4 [Branchiostoma lanceolatum]|uniref:FNBP4 protein n=1 Tax=Branchiostoma lanceolatum TaxID=7740 RepID=A0A8J9ZKM8_BRALA|nr:FNBP4 [Branchiostoma lanceolatum]